MAKKMRAAVMTDIRKVEIQERDIPVPKDDEALVKVEYVGVCGSDLHYYEHGGVDLPFILGHEASGTVVEVGAKVSNLKVGDRVALEPGKTCGHCEFCKSGRYNLCPDVIFFAAPGTDGVFCEYVAHEAALCFKLPDNMSTLEGAMIEPLAVGFHGANLAGVEPGKVCVVSGSGCIGLMSMMACFARGATQVYVTDVLDNRLQKALSLGATGVINVKDKDALKEIEALTDGKGPDIFIDTAGTEETIALGLRCIKRGGTIIQVGMSGGFGKNISVPLSVALTKEITFKTMFRYRNIYPMAIDCVSSGRIPVKDVVTDIFEFDDIQNALDQSVDNKARIVKAAIRIS